MSIKNKGDGNTNNSGNNNDFRKYEAHYYDTAKSINRSYLFDFCLEFSKIELAPDNEYDTSTVSGYEDKMDYNEIDIYKDIFTACAHYIEDVESILNEIPNRELLVKNINTVYKKMKKFESWPDKDHLCDLVFKNLYTKLAENISSNDLVEEQANEAIHTIMYYALTKCKLLDPIPEPESIAH